MPSEDFAQLTSRLRELGGQRVWSLMISLFGDLAQAEGDIIDGPALTAMMNLLEVKPEATRVALHRLRNDGWITSVKSGRISHHSLTPKGRSESLAASPRIYEKPGASEQGWQLALSQEATPEVQSSAKQNGFAPLTDRVFLGPSDAQLPVDAVSFSGGSVPAWLPEQLEPTGLRPEYAALMEVLMELKDILPHPPTMPALEIAVLRCLIVHNWRRLVLKHPKLPTALVTPDWPGLSCHKLVSEILDRYPRPKLADIRQEHAGA